ncbi:MAG: hypothetical protein EOO51_13705, partial [Flavobacterium sp.]
MRYLCLMFILFSFNLTAQPLTDAGNVVEINPAKTPAPRLSDNVFTYCDTNADGFIPIDLQSISNLVLSDHADDFGYDEGIYLCTAGSKVLLVSNIETNPQVTQICQVGTPSTPFDIAANQDGDLYVCAGDQIVKINSATCASQQVYNYSVASAINSLSFDRNYNMYMGGFSSSVYRLNSGDYNTMVPWHDFNQGMAAGDFVMYGDKMYIAWRTSGGCELFEVTVDAANNYVSHIVLGDLPGQTFGLASELGYLYGVTPGNLYRINLNPMTFQNIVTNGSGDSWYGAAGKNEAVKFEVQTFESIADAQANVNALPSFWINTVSGGQTVYVTIRNVITNQIVTIPVELIVNTAPSYTNPQTLTQCYDSAQPSIFDLAAASPGILGSQTDVTISYHGTEADALASINPLPNLYVPTTDPATVYVRLVKNGTSCFTTFSMLVRTVALPVLNQPGDITVCSAANVPIDALVPINQQLPQILGNQDSATYQVSFHQSLTDAVSSVNPLPPLYHVSASVTPVFIRIENIQSGCFSTGSFTINAFQETQNLSLQFSVDAHDWTDGNNAISVSVDESGDYEYSLDGVNYSDDHEFSGLPIGVYSIYVRDKHNCGVGMKEVILLMYPKFFTPNRDGFHDFWNVKLA